MRPGDVILLYFMPYPLADRLIYRVTNSHLDHVAICLPWIDKVLGENKAVGTDVYEAQPPRCRKMSADAYLDQIQEWALQREQWRRKTGNYLKFTILRRPEPFSTDRLLVMRAEAERWLGKRYSMVWNYLLRLNTIHCSELVARCLTAGDVVWDWGTEYSRVTPVMVKERLRDLGWEW